MNKRGGDFLVSFLEGEDDSFRENPSRGYQGFDIEFFVKFIFKRKP